MVLTRSSELTQPAGDDLFMADRLSRFRPMSIDAACHAQLSRTRQPNPVTSRDRGSIALAPAVRDELPALLSATASNEVRFGCRLEVQAYPAHLRRRWRIDRIHA